MLLLSFAHLICVQHPEQAIAYRKYSFEYVAEEEGARAAKVGMWLVSSKTHRNSAISLVPRRLVRDAALAAVRKIWTVLAGDAEGEAPIHGRAAPPCHVL
jgi:hypothetical protein